MTSATHTVATVAERYGHSREYVLRKTRNGDWPHLRVGRSVVFTDAHLVQIDAMHEIKAERSVASASWGRKTRKAS